MFRRPKTCRRTETVSEAHAKCSVVSNRADSSRIAGGTRGTSKGASSRLGPRQVDRFGRNRIRTGLDSDVATFDETQSLQLMNSLETLTVAQGNEAYRIEPCLRGASRRAGREANAIPAAKWADIRTAAKEQEKTTIVLDLSKQRVR